MQNRIKYYANHDDIFIVFWSHSAYKIQRFMDCEFSCNFYKEPKSNGSPKLTFPVQFRLNLFLIQYQTVHW